MPSLRQKDAFSEAKKRHLWGKEVAFVFSRAGAHAHSMIFQKYLHFCH
jgi:hypothetical protein